MAAGTEDRDMEKFSGTWLRTSKNYTHMKGRSKKEDEQPFPNPTSTPWLAQQNQEIIGGGGGGKWTRGSSHEVHTSCVAAQKTTNEKTECGSCGTVLHWSAHPGLPRLKGMREWAWQPLRQQAFSRDGSAQPSRPCTTMYI